MRLPSLSRVLADAQAAFSRFPFVLLAAVLGTCAAVLLADHEGPAEASILFNILLACILGLPLLTALALFAEKRGYGKAAAVGLQLAGVLLLAGYALTVPPDLMHAPSLTIFRFFILGAALVMLLTVLPFSASGEVNGFWHYSKSLFLRLLTALVYSFVLFIGLLIALAALDQLFGVDVPSKRYLQLFIAIGGFFSPWFFLAGLPENLSELDARTDYPKGLKVFAQYILLPLVLVYLLILYAYLVKILLAWDWPKGWVSALILGYSVAGIFAFLLLHPLAGKPDHQWIGRAGRWFYVLLVPPVVMLFLAVWRRISEYGVTEGRYIVVAFGIWLVLMILYFTLGKKKSIKIIPASLCIFALALSFGPWGAFSAAEQSQIGRLQGILERSGILVNGTVRSAHNAVSFEDAKQISAILDYLRESHGLAGIQPWFTESLKADTVPTSIAYKSPPAVATMMGVEFVEWWGAEPGGIVTLEPETPYDPAGYNRMMRIQSHAAGTPQREVPTDGLAYQVAEGCHSMTFTAIPGGAEILRIDLKKYAESLMKDRAASPTGRMPVSKLGLTAAGNGLRVHICPWDLQIQEHDGETRILRLNATVLYTVEKPETE